ncbi:ribosome biogenesis GTPase YlqF [Borrelia anserina]|uniref:Ribosome biogenesis GTPase A n=2 Tax=Borrelia anserina TaxID=143 RepID=W5SNW6_BORAN|nr:ribosome biogenesis GTPase YlqF [Borrelia anserina]AHH08612.1 GTP-binding protein [Borrelia anserina BA2]APR65073.1 ribosome biogenesis GTPase YlqF [Borrelia anserina Es]UPA07001.1 ribosome biogenesis GTPase YlqF [Borrelia anserina]
MSSKINWFPGHMKRASDLIKENLKRTNIVLEILDARAPLSSKNPLIEKIIKNSNKDKIILLNKSDLVKEEEILKWKEYFETLGNNVLITNIYKKGMRKQIIDNIKKTVNVKKIRNYREKIKALLIGVPNVGKSSIINLLVGRKSTSVANKPGYTKNIQIVKVNEKINIFDTPGILWHNLEDQEIAKKLAILDMIKNETIDNTELALYLLREMHINNKTKLLNKYNITSIDSLEILEKFARTRGFINKKNEIDLEQASKILIKEYREGKFGKIILDVKHHNKNK